MHDDANPVHLNALSVFLVLGAHAGPGVVPVPMELVPVESTSKEKRPGRGERKVSVSLVPAAVTGPPGQRQAGSWVLRAPAVGERLYGLSDYATFYVTLDPRKTPTGASTHPGSVTVCVSNLRDWKIGEIRFLFLIDCAGGDTHARRSEAAHSRRLARLALYPHSRPTHARGERTRLKCRASPSQYTPWQHSRPPCLVAPRDGRAPTPQQQP